MKKQVENALIVTTLKFGKTEKEKHPTVKFKDIFVEPVDTDSAQKINIQAKK